jgi:hypothetical protein
MGKVGDKPVLESKSHNMTDTTAYERYSNSFKRRKIAYVIMPRRFTTAIHTRGINEG